MPDNIILYIILGVVAIVVILVITIFILRYMKGSIKINLSQQTFGAGDLIKGSFELNAKKAIQGNRLFVSFVGTEVPVTREDGKSKTRKRQIYKDEIVLESDKEYPAGYLETHDFEIAVPDMDAGSDLGKVLTGALELLTNRRTSLTMGSQGMP